MSVAADDFDLLTVPRDEYLHARLHAAALKPEVAEDVLRELRGALIDARLVRLLLEYEVAFTMTEEEMLEFVKTAAEILAGTRIAFVAPDSKHAPSFGFGTSVANYSGHDHRFFKSLAPAEEWLLTDAD